MTLHLAILAVIILNLVIAGVVTWRRRTYPAGLAFVFFVLASAFWATCVWVLQSAPGTGIALWVVRAAHVGAAFIGISWIWFCVDFPSPQPRYRHIAWVVTITGLPWLALAWGPSLITGVQHAAWGIDATPGSLMLVYTLWLALGMGLGIVHLAYKARKERGLHRLQIRYILLGCVGMLLIGSLCNLILPLLTGSFRYAPYSPLAFLCLTIATAYAILRHRLLGIHTILRASVIYTLTILALALLFTGIHTILEAHFAFSPMANSFLVALVVTLAFVPLRNLLQGFVDRYLFQRIADYQAALRGIGHALLAARDDDALISALADALQQTLHPYAVAIYTSDGKMYRQHALRGEWQELPESVPADRWYIQFACDTDEVLLSEELIGQFDERRQLGLLMQKNSINLALPLQVGEKILGVILLGEKRSGDIYTSDDLDLLRLVARQAAMTLDNIRSSHAIAVMRESERLRMQFFSYISHELRTPLTPVMSGIEALRQHLLGSLNPQQEQAVEMIDRHAQRLNRLIADILDLYQLEHRGMALHGEPHSLPKLIDESLTAYRTLYGEKGLYLRCIVNDDVPLVPVDAQRFAQVLDNLLDNAYKFTASGGVTVSLHLQGMLVRILVSDTGIGLSEEETTMIFAPYYQIAHHSRKGGGAGLGLAIAKQLVEAHGGRIWVESAGHGLGSRFVVELPFGNDRGDQAPRNRNTPKTYNSKLETR